MDEPGTGDLAPDFTLPRAGGGQLSLSDLRGKKVVLYFYPKDDTSGCTRQACGLRDSNPEIEARGALVVGVSPDTVASHDAFVAKYGLPFALVSDTDHRVAEAYGVWKEKRNYGRAYMGIERSTFLIDGEGRIAKVWRKVGPDNHADLVLQALAG